MREYGEQKERRWGAHEGRGMRELRDEPGRGWQVPQTGLEHFILQNITLNMFLKRTENHGYYLNDALKNKFHQINNSQYSPRN